MHWLLGVDGRIQLLPYKVGPNQRADEHVWCRCPVWFLCVADIVFSRESQLSVERPAHDGAADHDAYGLVWGICLYRSERLAKMSKSSIFHRLTAFSHLVLTLLEKVRWNKIGILRTFCAEEPNNTV